MDVCTRFVLGWILKYSIRKTDVVLLLSAILHGVQGVMIIIRNDNGSQFLSYLVRKYLEDMPIVTQEFTHIATPEENAYIESLHSMIEKELLKRNWFESIYHAKEKIRDYYLIYNYRRKHRSLKRRSPYQYLAYFFPEFSDKHPFVFSDDLSRVALNGSKACAATRLALDKFSSENNIFVASEVQENLLN